PFFVNHPHFFRANALVDANTGASLIASPPVTALITVTDKNTSVKLRVAELSHRGHRSAQSKNLSDLCALRWLNSATRQVCKARVRASSFNRALNSAT